jgi:hypothetical protein
MEKPLAVTDHDFDNAPADRIAFTSFEGGGSAAIWRLDTGQHLVQINGAERWCWGRARDFHEAVEWASAAGVIAARDFARDAT